MARYYYWEKKDTIEGTLGADLSKVKHLIKKGLCSITTTQGSSGSNFCWYVYPDNGSVWFSYTTINNRTGEKTKHSYSRDLVFTNCHFGGKRPWFVCPCGRKVRALFIGGRDNEVYCRHCLRLTYQSTRETNYSRIEFKILNNMVKLEQAIHDLKLKTRYYNGKPTRKYKKYLALERKYDRFSDSERYDLEKLLLKK